MPTGNDSEAIHHQVIGDLQERLEFGTRKYGQPLQAFNGRNAAQDAYEETLDQAVYLKQMLVEQQAKVDAINKATRDLVEFVQDTAEKINAVMAGIAQGMAQAKAPAQCERDGHSYTMEGCCAVCGDRGYPNRWSTVPPRVDPGM